MSGLKRTEVLCFVSGPVEAGPTVHHGQDNANNHMKTQVRNESDYKDSASCTWGSLIAAPQFYQQEKLFLWFIS